MIFGKPPFRYWWKFKWEGSALNKVVVRSTDPKFKDREFSFAGQQDATEAIEQAEKFIDGVESGRIDGHKGE